MPVYIVFCNSLDMHESRIELKLSDLFTGNSKNTASALRPL